MSMGDTSLEVTNTPGTAKVLGSNLIGACFFLNKNIVGLLFVCFFSWLRYHILDFLPNEVFVLVAYYVFLYSCNL